MLFLNRTDEDRYEAAVGDAKSSVIVFGHDLLDPFANLLGHQSRPPWSRRVPPCEGDRAKVQYLLQAELQVPDVSLLAR